MATAEKLIEEIKKMSVLELSELIKALEEEFGVSATADGGGRSGRRVPRTPRPRRSPPRSTWSSPAPATRRSR